MDCGAVIGPLVVGPQGLQETKGYIQGSVVAELGKGPLSLPHQDSHSRYRF